MVRSPPCLLQYFHLHLHVTLPSTIHSIVYFTLILTLLQAPRHGDSAFSVFTRPPLPSHQLSQSRASLISPTPSVEADDERDYDSSWDYSDSAMDDLDERERADAEEARHTDEDTRPTSRKELWGWYSYGWAAEVFAICAMGMPRPFEPSSNN